MVAGNGDVATPGWTCFFFGGGGAAHIHSEMHGEMGDCLGELRHRVNF